MFPFNNIYNYDIFKFHYGTTYQYNLLLYIQVLYIDVFIVYSVLNNYLVTRNAN